MSKIRLFFWLNILDKSNILSQQKMKKKICVRKHLQTKHPQQSTSEQLAFLNH